MGGGRRVQPRRSGSCREVAVSNDVALKMKQKQYEATVIDFVRIQTLVYRGDGLLGLSVRFTDRTEQTLDADSGGHSDLGARAQPIAQGTQKRGRSRTTPHHVRGAQHPGAGPELHGPAVQGRLSLAVYHCADHRRGKAAYHVPARSGRGQFYRQTRVGQHHY